MATDLEQVMPVYHFRERHTRWIRADAPSVWEALTTLTLDQLRIARPLMAVRHLGSRPVSSPRSLFTDGPVTMMNLTPPSYAIGGAIARPWQSRSPRRKVASLDEFTDFMEPGWVKYLLDFRLEPRGGGIQLSTETRGHSTDRHARNLFALYWTLIRPASGLIRRDMLATIGRLAQRDMESRSRRVDIPAVALAPGDRSHDDPRGGA